MEEEVRGDTAEKEDQIKRGLSGDTKNQKISRIILEEEIGPNFLQIYQQGLKLKILRQK